MDEHWSLYCMDANYVYFVYMPKPTRMYNVKHAPFMFVKQYKEALKLGRIPLETFAKLGEAIPKPKGTLVFVPSAARSGSTLIVSMLQCNENMSVYGVNDVFTNLGLFETENLLSKDLRDKLLISCLKFWCRNQTTNDVTVIKPRGIVMAFVPTIAELMPYVKQFYIFRKDTTKVLQSVYKMRKMAYGDNVSLKIAKFSRILSSWMFGWFVTGCQSWKQFGTKDTWDYVLNMHVLNYAGYCKNKQHFSIDCVVYEDVLAKPIETMQSVFKLCEISEQFRDDAIASALLCDSQDGTALSKKRMAAVSIETLGSDKTDKIKHICRTMDVPLICGVE